MHDPCVRMHLSCKQQQPGSKTGKNAVVKMEKEKREMQKGKKWHFFNNQTISLSINRVFYPMLRRILQFRFSRKFLGPTNTKF